jgi:hypothetical protein
MIREGSEASSILSLRNVKEREGARRRKIYAVASRVVDHVQKPGHAKPAGAEHLAW